jgi:hypothetical protein
MDYNNATILLNVLAWLSIVVPLGLLCLITIYNTIEAAEYRENYHIKLHKSSEIIVIPKYKKDKVNQYLSTYANAYILN